MHQPDRIIRLKTVLAQLRISIHGTGWRESDIDRWVNDPSGWRLEREAG